MIIGLRPRDQASLGRVLWKRSSRHSPSSSSPSSSSCSCSSIMAVKSVPQGHEWTVERFGRYTGSLRPGLGFIVPFIDRIGAKINMMESVLDVPTQEVITKDNAMVSVDGVVFYQVLDCGQGGLRGQQPRERDPQPHHDQHPNGHGLDGSGRAAVAARQDQRAIAARGRRRDPALGHQGDAHRDQGHRPAARPGRFHGAPDEGRAREARADPGSRRLARRRDPARRGREAIRDPGGRRPARSLVPRSRSARAPGGSGSQGDAGGLAGDRRAATCRRSTTSSAPSMSMP